MRCCRPSGASSSGSHIKGYADERSEIDVCLILSEGADRAPIYRHVLTAGEHYDIVIFD
ncbi:hypothetical protein KH990_09120 [Methanoculleus bourgensis]|jgi:hypothetical protein|uniref:Uncharacterized protein n=1 Tax=Methanoculleus bourgensis TaxID=83986 RepID=A0A0X3BKQ1_9EURY|nr:hypothetical protein [Methanoculleus bourgensis]MBT0733525.1 hypothetical protein [Methanoculleus bourgensis]NMA88324.1 hypothetical protein [Methanoculleus bourgensis]CVK32712.1 protein of unknown function [Methanoculleus bourgensis]